MAIYHSALFDSLRNRLSNTVFYKKGPDGIIRTRPAKVKNPRTPEQQVQRARMGAVIELSRRFAPIIATGFCNRPTRLTAYNMFTKLNVNQVDVDEHFLATPQLDKIVVSDGILAEPTVNIDKTGENIKFTNVPRSADGLCAGDDVIYAGIYNTAEKSSRLHRISTRAEDTFSSFSIPENWNTEDIHIYLFAVSRSKKRTSPTVYKS